MSALFDRLGEHVGRHPDQLLFSFLDVTGAEVERHTYASFQARVELLASHLAGRTAPGDRALLVYPPGLELIAAIFACAHVGVLPVPTAPPTAHGSRAPTLRLEHIAADADAQLLLTTGAVADRLLELSALAERTAKGLAWLQTDTLREPAGVAPLRANGAFLLQYTSGSTNDPKGVVVSHENVLHNCDLVVDHPQPVAVSWLPQHHDMGLLGYYIYIALSGGTTYGFSPSTFIQRPSLWLETITDRRGTATSAPNFAFEYCLRPGRISEASYERLDLASLEFLMAAAEPIRPETYRRFLRAFEPVGLRPEAYFVAYGLAENTLAVTNYGRHAVSVDKRRLAEGQARLVDDVADVAQAVRLMSCGPAFDGVDVRVVEPELRREVPAGSVGEIWVAGPSKGRGYYGRPEATAATFGARLADDPDGPAFLRTGDLGFMHDGELFVCGRRKDVIIIRGRNLYPQDVEAVVERVCPEARRVAAFEVTEGVEASVGVVVEVRKRDRPDAGAIVAAVRDELDAEVGAVAFVPPKSIPHTSSGKVQRQRTRQLFEAGELTVLDAYARDRADPAEGPPAEGGSGLTHALHGLAHRYGLDDPSLTLVETGIDSIDLVTLMLEVKEVLRAHGADDLADAVDVRLVQRLSLADLFALADAIETEPDAAVAGIREHLAGVQRAQAEEERAMMEADRSLPFTPPEIPPYVPVEPEEVLLTGGTGFLGPFLLRDLLGQTDARVHVLVRAASDEAARERLWANFEASLDADDPALAQFDGRVVAVRGDLAQPALGLDAETWDRLSHVDAIVHNGAAVNYLHNYAALRAANVAGTAEVIRLAFEGGPTVLNHVSTTFIYGWATKPFLYETDRNDGMDHLDFGYSQSKWVSEQLVFDAQRHGLPVRVFRPALITPAQSGGGTSADITMRLLSFMTRHGIGVDAGNQVSLMPADVTATNVVAIAADPATLGGTFHVVRDAYATMGDVTRIIHCRTGRSFEHFPLQDFVPEVVRRCTREDPLYPLLNFLVRSVDNISAMEFKRYDSAQYRAARDASPDGLPDPPMEAVVGGILEFLDQHEML